MNIKELQQKYKLIDLFVELAKIPSPPMEEEKVADKILEIFKENNINACKDDFGNVIAKINATDSSKKPILLSAHMDVVGDDSPVNIVLCREFIQTDKTRTLGADNKAGVAAAMLLAMEINNEKNLTHGGLEIVFTRDEEHSMSGINNVDMASLESEYILVLDADKLGQVLLSGAGFTKLTIKVEAAKGGHSGIDIADETRLNAVKLIAEIINKIPQGVYKKNDFGVVTSINAGAIIAGGVHSGISKVSKENTKTDEYFECILHNSMTNIINTQAGVIYSIRSSEPQEELNLISEVEKIIFNFNNKYKGLAEAILIKETHLLPFEKCEDETIKNIAEKASARAGIIPNISSFHAGAETHIYSNRMNKSMKKFKPALVGLADIYNMHSCDERLDYPSYLKGYEFLKEFFTIYNS